MWLIKGTLVALLLYVARQEIRETVEDVHKPVWWFVVYLLLLVCWIGVVIVVKV